MRGKLPPQYILEQYFQVLLEFWRKKSCGVSDVNSELVMKKYVVQLTEAERIELQNLCKKGKQLSRKIRKANILLEADKNQSDEAIAENLCISVDTVERTRRRFVEGNLEYALNDYPRGGRPKMFDGIQEAALVALACTKPPNGRCVWTAAMLANQMVQLGVIEAISPESADIEKE